MNSLILFIAFACFSLQSFSQDSFNEDVSLINTGELSFPLAGGGNSAKNIVHFTLSGGISQLVYKVEGLDSEQEKYLKDLRRGFYIQSDASYVLSDYFSVGVKYNFHKSKNELADVTFMDINGNTIVGSISNDISISFIGLGLNGRLLSESEKSILNAGLAIGTISYTEDAELLDKITAEGNAIGMLYNVGYEYAVNESFGLGFNFNYSFGTITNVKLDGVELTGEDAFKIGTGRIQLGIIGLFHF
ncbi:MAG: hypothetical protein HKO56_00740 [Bacteroidia bacterium]|nr:hypothetical protein [Bacteroidia bacterium]NNC84528.1 hypothetical protein [Bacteroidia bacterium]NNM15152.1 hypothetical protein [Bacteroidia bacterium]